MISSTILYQVTVGCEGPHWIGGEPYTGRTAWGIIRPGGRWVAESKSSVIRTKPCGKTAWSF